MSTTCKTFDFHDVSIAINVMTWMWDLHVGIVIESGSWVSEKGCQRLSEWKWKLKVEWVKKEVEGPTEEEGSQTLNILLTGLFVEKLRPMFQNDSDKN